MKEIQIKVVVKSGPKTATLVVPETMAEALTVFGAEKIYKLAMRSYIENSKRTLRGARDGRKKALKIKLKDLTIEQREGLVKLGFMKEEM